MTVSFGMMEAVSESELEEVIQSLLKFAGESKIIAFYGEMGAGKTTLIKYFCKVLHVEETVHSPTFSLVNEYKDESGKSVYHFDFYRIKRESEAVDLGIQEYFDSGCYCLIEWPEKILNLLPKPVMKVMMRTDGEKRLITFSYD